MTKLTTNDLINDTDTNHSLMVSTSSIVERRGTAGNDLLVANGETTLSGLAGNDTLIGSSAYLMGDEGNDMLIGTLNGQTVGVGYGGTGNDILGNLQYAYGDNGRLVEVAGDVGGNDIIHNAQYAWGDAGNDWIQVTTAANGGSGNDSIIGDDAAQRLFGGSGNDVILAGGGDDFIAGGQTTGDLGLGSTGWDHLPDGNDYIEAGAGNDTVYGNAGNDHLYGQAGNDELRGGAGSDFLFGGAGNDTIFGYQQHDTTASDYIDGGAGNDFIVYDTGANTILGGDGDDRITMGFNSFQLGRPNVMDSLILGGQGNDYIEITGSSRALGGEGNDTLVAHVTGLASDGFGNQYNHMQLLGNEGNDRLIVNDSGHILGTSQTVHLNGGSGADVFNFNIGFFEGSSSNAQLSKRNYVVHDFEVGIDQLQLRVASDGSGFNFLADNQTISGVQSIMYNGVQSTSLIINAQGANAGQFQITLVGVDPSAFAGGPGFPG